MQNNQNPNEERLSIADVRKALGMIERNYTDEQIAEVVGLMLDASEWAYDHHPRVVAAD